MAKVEPVMMPPVVLHDNPDGTSAWPCDYLGFRHWHLVRGPQDVPEYYLTPPTTPTRARRV